MVMTSSPNSMSYCTINGIAQTCFLEGQRTNSFLFEGKPPFNRKNQGL